MAERRAFRFGVINESPRPIGGWVEHVRRVEALGYDTFLIRDHLLPDYFGPQLGPIAALATAAAVTSRLRVGTMVISNDFRHPAMLAKELATIDHLSGGRLEVGIGAGWLRAEYEAAGIRLDPAGVRLARLEESLQILKGLFAGEPVTFAGEHYHVSGLASFPAACQRPHPPILIGAGKRRMLQLAGREADIVGVLTTSVASGVVEDDPRERMAGSVEQKLGWVREGAGARYDQIELSLIPTVLITNNRRERAAQLIAERGWSGVAVEDVLAMPSLLIGSVDAIVDDLLARRERYGFSYYVVADTELEAFLPVVERTT